MKIAERQERMGSDSANGILGYCYEHGYGTEQNLSLAIDYYRERQLNISQNIKTTTNVYLNNYIRMFHQVQKHE